MSRRVVAVATHPIQYHAPWFRALAQRPELDFEVAFLEIPDAVSQGRGFGIAFQWDAPLRDGYRSRVLSAARLVGGHGFFGKRLRSPQSAMRALQPDVLLLTGWQCLPLVQAVCAARRMGIPVLMRGDSNALKPRGRVVALLHHLLFSQVTAFLVVGKANRALFRGHGVDEGRLFQAPYFVDNDAFAAAALELRPRRDEIRASLGIHPDAVCFLFAGKFEAKKRPMDLVEAIAQIARTQPHLVVHAVMVGAGVLDAPLRSRVAERHLAIHFTGFLNQTEIARAYVAADALVLPSDFDETWGLVVNEAMACGLPAIVSDRAGCAADLVEPGLTGAVFPCGDVGALAGTLASLAREPIRLQEMGGNAERHVHANYTLERSVEAVLRAVAAV